MTVYFSYFYNQFRVLQGITYGDLFARPMLNNRRPFQFKSNQVLVQCSGSRNLATFLAGNFKARNNESLDLRYLDIASNFEHHFETLFSCYPIFKGITYVSKFFILFLSKSEAKIRQMIPFFKALFLSKSDVKIRQELPLFKAFSPHQLGRKFI